MISGWKMRLCDGIADQKAPDGVIEGLDVGNYTGDTEDRLQILFGIVR